MQPTGNDGQGNPELDAYVAGTASEAEQAAFEEALIASPRLAAELEVRQRIKAGLELLETRDQLDPLLKTSPTSAWKFALAASVAIALIAAGVLWKSGSGKGEWLASKQTLSLVMPAHVSAFDGSVILARTRGSPPKVTVSREGGIVQLRLPLVEQMPDMRLRLDSAGPEKPAVSLPASAAGFVEIYLDTSGLEPGIHSLILSADGKDFETYELEIAYRN